MTPQQKIALILCVFSSTAYPHAYAGPFLTNSTAPQVIQQPLAVNPEVKALCHGTQAQCNGLPLASPRNSSVGIVSAFLATNLSQANPNSTMPAVSKTCAQWTWSGSDNSGWQCTAKPKPQPAKTPTPQPIPTATCQGMAQTFYCTLPSGQEGGVGVANGQPACFNGNLATNLSTGQTFLCTSYN
jgi:hypothetical protein